jgi:hypothetical protein
MSRIATFFFDYRHAGWRTLAEGIRTTKERKLLGNKVAFREALRASRGGFQIGDPKFD